MFRVLADGDGTHRLEDAEGTPIGWIRGRVIGLRGLEDQAQAMAVAIAAWRALDAALRRQFSGWPRYEPDLDRLRVVHDGVHDWISDGATSLARLIALDGGAGPRASSYALEFALPSFASEGFAVTAAQLMGRAFHERATTSARVVPLAGVIADAAANAAADAAAPHARP